MNDYRMAFIDIETAPSLGYVWQKWDANVLSFEKDWYIMSFSVKWAGSKKVETWALPDFPLFAKDSENDRDLVKKLWEVFNEADCLVGHNGDRFDLKKSNARFIYHHLPPPAPYKTIDTLKIAKKVFAFTSNKLNDLAQYLGIGQKIKTGGFDLWMRCVQLDMSAWRLMKRYNAHDVLLLEKVYERFRGWHKTHPNTTVKSESSSYQCPACGGTKVQRRGWEYIQAFRAQRFQCQNRTCMKWSKGPREKIPGELLT